MENKIIESKKWLRSTKSSVMPLRSWMIFGPRPTTMANETKFCDPDILTELLNAKNKLDRIDRDTYLKARSICNPFEEIGRSIFQNRAAVKMANLDALFDWMFTEPTSDVACFADICGGPGGFSEYVLWRTKNTIKGFGFTLRGRNDFKLDISPKIFDRYYGFRNNGNILDPKNILSLKSYIMQSTHGTGVNFMMADGAFHVYDENMQEIIFKQLYLCQCLVGLWIVRDGGNAVIKLFDCFTKFTVGLIFLMYKCFGEICIVKPNSSRPGNSERYLVCKNKKANLNIIQQFLMHVNNEMWYNHAEVLELVPYAIVSDDKDFMDYIRYSNNTVGRTQIAMLLQIVEFISNKQTSRKEKEKHVITECLRMWRLPSFQEFHKKKVSTFKSIGKH